MLKSVASLFLVVFSISSARLALTSKAFQYVPLSIALERGYMKEEGIDLKFVIMQNAIGLQALTANTVQFSGSGSCALVAISKGNAPLKTVLAFSDQVPHSSPDLSTHATGNA